MASATDVRAGRAYVELGTRDSALLKGLQAALARVRKFAEQARDIGGKIALFGTGGASGIVAVTKHFASAGVEMAKLSRQTGLGATALSGIAQAAENAEVPLAELAPKLTRLQRNIAEGGKAIEDSFAGLGTSLDAIRQMKFEDVLGLIADRLPGVADETQRVALATDLFGRGGERLLPVLEGGSAALNAAAQQAQALGTALDGRALEAAAELDDAFDALAASATGLRNAAGTELAPAVVAITNAITGAVQAATAWVQQNPELVRATVGWSIAIAGLGTAVAAVGVALLALTSPATLIVSLIVALGGAALAVTDTLGLTSSGFGDLFNSIRIGGQGLGTWFSKFWIYLIAGFEGVIFGAKSGWDYLVTATENAGNRLYAALIWVPKAILLAFSKMVDGISSILGTLGLDPLGSGTVDRWIEALDAKQEELARRVGANNAEFDQNQAVRRAALEAQSAPLHAKLAELNAADPDDGTVFGVDTARAKAALATIGENIGEELVGALKADGPQGLALSGASPFGGAGAAAAAATGTAALQAAAPAVAAVEAAQQFDVLGTFNAAAAGRIGFGTSLEERQARAAEGTERNTRALLDELRGGALTGTFQ